MTKLIEQTLGMAWYAWLMIPGVFVAMVVAVVLGRSVKRRRPDDFQ